MNVIWEKWINAPALSTVLPVFQQLPGLRDIWNACSLNFGREDFRKPHLEQTSLTGILFVLPSIEIAQMI